MNAVNIVNIIPNECHQLILRTLDTFDLLNCEVVCRLWKNCIDQFKKVDILFKEEFNDLKKISQYDARLIAAFGGIKNIKNLPITPFNGQKDKWGNFDFEPKLMGNVPIMRSRDQYGKDYLFFNLVFSEGIRTVLTVFQTLFYTKSSDIKNGWKAKCWCIYNENNFNNYGYPLEEKNFQVINKLMKNKAVEVVHENKLTRFAFIPSK